MTRSPTIHEAVERAHEAREPAPLNTACHCGPFVLAPGYQPRLPERFV